MTRWLAMWLLFALPLAAAFSINVVNPKATPDVRRDSARWMLASFVWPLTIVAMVVGLALASVWAVLTRTHKAFKIAFGGKQ